jgi:hypothetical protein
MSQTRSLIQYKRRHTSALRSAILAATVFCGLALAQTTTPLVTIQDTLFMADGARFNGTLTIRWSTFDTTNGTIVQQSRTVSVTNGNLQVLLAANAGAPSPANSYSVAYQSDGREQFGESWTVPQVTRSLKVAEVRTGTYSSSTATGSVGNQTPIAQSAVVGLLTELAQRPTKGPGFGVGSVAVINQSGQIETAAGNIGDCVYVDGTAGACGGPSPQFFDAEIPGGVVDGVNQTFTLANPPSGTSLMLFRNGMYMKAGFDYNLTSTIVQFVSGAIPQPEDTLVASYRIDSSAGNVGNIVTEGTNRRTLLAQVLCSSAGRSSNRDAWGSLGTCEIPAGALNPGDRIEVRYNYSHTGTTVGFDAQVLWGTNAILLRHGNAQDAALVGHSDASIATTGAQITTESWGTVLPFLPAIVSVNPQSGVKIDILGKMDSEGPDTLALTNLTVLRYPGN